MSMWCRIVVATLAVVVLTGCAFTQQSSPPTVPSPPPVPSLVDLSAAAPVAEPLRTISIPDSTKVYRWMVPPGGLLLTSDAPGGQFLQLLQWNAQRPSWSITVADDARWFNAGPNALGLYDKALGLTRLDYNTGIILSRYPITGEKWVRAGDQGRRLYVLPRAGNPWRNYQMIMAD